MARPRDDRGSRAVRRTGHPGILFVCEEILPLRQLLHRRGRPVDAESPDAPVRRFTDHRQSAAAQPADDPDPLVAAEEPGTISLDVAELWRVAESVNGRGSPPEEAPVGEVLRGVGPRAALPRVRGPS